MNMKQPDCSLLCVQRYLQNTRLDEARQMGLFNHAQPKSSWQKGGATLGTVGRSAVSQSVRLSVCLSVRARTTKNYFFDKKPLLKSSKKEDDCTNFYQNRTFYERVTPKSKFDRYTSPCFDILRNLLAPGGGTDRFHRLDISYEVGASAAMM